MQVLLVFGLVHRTLFDNGWLLGWWPEIFGTNSCHFFVTTALDPVYSLQKLFLDTNLETFRHNFEFFPPTICEFFRHYFWIFRQYFLIFFGTIFEFFRHYFDFFRHYFLIFFGTIFEFFGTILNFSALFWIFSALIWIFSALIWKLFGWRSGPP